MSKLMDERLKKEAYRIALKTLEIGKLTLDEIANVCGLTIDEVKQLAEENNIVI